MKISTLVIWVLKIDTVGDLMIGSNKHKYKRRIMKEFGMMKGREKFRQKELMLFMNTYVSTYGRRHSRASTTPQQLSNLLRGASDFQYIPGGNVGYWYYVGES